MAEEKPMDKNAIARALTAYAKLTPDDRKRFRVIVRLREAEAPKAEAAKAAEGEAP